MADGIRYNVAACTFWIVATATVVSSASFASACLIGIGGCCAGESCFMLEIVTISFVVLSLLMTFYHCYRQKLKHAESPSFYVDTVNLTSDTNINTRYTPLPVIMSKIEEHREDLLRAVQDTDVPDDFECAICNESITNQVSKLSCDHFFHKACVLQWFLSNSQHTCPVCRSCQIPTNHLLVITVLPGLASRPPRPSQL